VGRVRASCVVWLRMKRYVWVKQQRFLVGGGGVGVGGVGGGGGGVGGRGGCWGHPWGVGAERRPEMDAGGVVIN